MPCRSGPTQVKPPETPNQPLPQLPSPLTGLPGQHLVRQPKPGLRGLSWLRRQGGLERVERRVQAQRARRRVVGR